MKKLLLLLAIICSFRLFAAPYADTVDCVGSYNDITGSLHVGTVLSAGRFPLVSPHHL